MNKYLDGVDVLGATLAPVSPSTPAPARALLIQVRDVGGLVEKQGGATGQFVFAVFPDTLQHEVYNKMKAEIEPELKKKGVDASVSVVSPAGFVPAGSSPFWKVTTIGLGIGIIAKLAWNFSRK